MGAITPRAYGDNPTFNNNLLPELSAFGSAITWNIVKDSGAGTVVPTNNATIKYKHENSLKIAANDFVGTIDAATGFLFTAARTGTYMMAIRVFAENSFNTEEAVLLGKLFKNDVEITESVINVPIKNNEFFSFGVWNTFYERFELEAGDELDLKFGIETASTNIEFYIDGLKLELDDRNINEPTTYLYPVAVV